MIAAIMQPYFFPYIGYFQLMHAVDIFIFFDNVQYINRGWVNRNQILLHRRPVWLTLPVASASRNLPINQRRYLLGEGVKPIKRKLRSAYPDRVDSVEAKLVDELLDCPDSNVASFNANLLSRLARTLGINCKFMMTSEMASLDYLRGEDKVIALCKSIGAHHYINPIGGMSLYDETEFQANDVSLAFLRTTSPATELRDGPRHLSIIDGLMQQGSEGCAARLDEYMLVAGHQ